MSEIKHTPGTWQAADDHVFNEIGILIPTIYGSNDDAIKANARLIAAAPELISAAEWAANYIDTIVDPNALKVLDSLRFAIAKARGQS